MSVKVISHKDELMRYVQEAFMATANAYDAQLHDAIRIKRNWTERPGFGVTRRRNKTIVVGNFRNIYDLGNLDRSQQMAVVERFRVRYSWDGMGITPAVIIHEGAVLRNGTRIPPRRFTRVAARDADLPKLFATAFRARLNHV